MTAVHEPPEPISWDDEPDAVPADARNPFDAGSQPQQHADWERQEAEAREQVRREREQRMQRAEEERQYLILVGREKAQERRAAELSPASAAAEQVAALTAEMLPLDQLDKLPPVEWLVKRVLPVDSQGQINGQPGTFKSFIALDLGMHVAAGMTDWHSYLIKKTGLVIYMAAEGGRGMRKRVKAWSLRHKIPYYRIQLRVMPRAVQAYKGGEWSAFVAACQLLGPVLIIVDTQARVTVGAEENSARDMGVVVERVEELRKATSACVLLIHHQGHNGGRGRGSSAVWGANDVELSLTRPDDRSDRKVTVTVAKQKDDEDGQAIYFEMATVDLGEVDEDDEEITSLVPVRRDPPLSEGEQSADPEAPKVDKEAERQAKAKAKRDAADETVYQVVWKLIEEGQPTSVRTIRGLAEMRNEAVVDSLTRLTMSGRLVAEPGARGSLTYRLPHETGQMTLVEEEGR